MSHDPRGTNYQAVQSNTRTARRSVSGFVYDPGIISNTRKNIHILLWVVLAVAVVISLASLYVAGLPTPR